MLLAIVNANHYSCQVPPYLTVFKSGGSPFGSFYVVLLTNNK